MRVKPFGPLAVALVALTLASCRGTSDLQAQSLAQWKAYCAARGKQFLWQDTETDEGVITRSVTVHGRCVGPGEPGYEPPAQGG